MNNGCPSFLKGFEHSAYELHEEHVNPAFVKMLRTIGFDKRYVRGQGCYLWDEDGHKYLDLLSGWGVFALGRNHPKIKAALAEVLAHDMPNLVRMECSPLSGLAAQMLTKHAGGDLSRVFYCNSGTETALTAVTGCSQLQQADGTLERVNGSSLVIKTASGQPVTVTTTATTFVSMSGPLLGDIRDGASVMVRGPRSDGTINAAIVTVGQPFSAVNPSGFVPVQGTVTDAGTAGFTLVTSSGTRIPVTTSGDTLVVIPRASLGQLQAGIAIFALGRPEPDGTLSASAVAAVSQLRSGAHIGVSVKDCSPSSIDEALGAISAAPVSAGAG